MPIIPFDPEDGGWSAPEPAKPARLTSAVFVSPDPALAAPEPDRPHKLAVDRNSWRSDSKGKGRYDLLIPEAIRRLAVRLEEGVQEHGERSWERNNTPQGRARCVESLLRHAFQVSEGQEDEDHLAAVMANAMMLIHFQSQQAEVDRLTRTGPRVGG